MTAAMNNTEASLIIERFKVFYRDLLAQSGVALHDIYADDVIFVDPVHRVNGLDEMTAYFDSLCGNITECRFEFLDEMVFADSAYIKWNMHYRHPKIGKDTITVRGVTHLNFDEKITYHEDLYDLGAMVYEHLPVIGSLTRMVKRKLAE